MPKPARRRPRTFPFRTLLLLGLLLLLGGAYAVWYHDTRLPLRGPEEPPLTLVVEPGATTLEVGRSLHAMGLVRHPEVFHLLVLERRASGKIRAGEYVLEGPLSLEDVLGKLLAGTVVRQAVTFPEGTDLGAMAEIAAAQGIPAPAFREAAREVSLIVDLDAEATDLEGYLFPDTYDITRRPDAAQALVRRMVARFRQVMVPERDRLAASGRSLREVVTLASLVERETALASERPRVAAVFLNRLQKKMPLQTDPTVIYAMKRAGRWDGNIRKKDLELDSPYNTYRYAGLPPGPIASPGREALRAVLAPASVQDLYFVSRNDGSHQFSETLTQHERAVDRYQRRRSPAAREGTKG
ncbi:MAG TPA: endolytic transglycosylase MltG [Vicinamibacteria bacterium]|nr:endolytic transglycosylase MltG [Vicinamibacteria bacterium]